MDKNPFDLSDNATPSPEIPDTPPEKSTPAEEPSAAEVREEKNPFFIERPYDTAAGGFYDPYRPSGTPENTAPHTPPTPPTYTPYTPPVTPPKKPRRTGAILLGVLLFLLGLGLGIGVFYALQQNDPADADGRPVQGIQGEQEKDEPADLSGGVFAPVYGDEEEAYNPAEIYAASVNGVVGISTEIITQNVFGQQTPAAVSGTGFVFSQDGYILTNCHIVEGATSITVTMYDGTEYDAALVGADSQNDVAVLKIDTDKELTVLTMGKSADMVVGEEILVIGNPLGELTYTLTRGIVSNLSRDITVEDSLSTIRMFQTDAAINSGNSGGPAINCYGNVIGIVSAKYASSSIEGLGFCIPIDDAMEIAQDLIEHGYVQGRPYLGIEGQAVSGYSGSTYIAGVRITALTDGGCAEKAGLKKGDIITRFGDTEVTTIAELKQALSEYKAGDSAELTVYRNRESVFVTVVLDEAKS